jgi:tetratricopeptide (TPR) repeat protein
MPADAPPERGLTVKETLEKLKRRVASLERLGYAVAALEVIARVLEREPQNAYYRFLRAENLRVIGRNDTVEKELLELVALVPAERKYLVHLSLGRFHTDHGRLAQAEEQYRRALALNPNTTVTYVFLATVLTRSDRFDEAYDVLTSGLHAEGDRDEVLLNMGNVKRALGEYDLASSHYQEALRLTPDYPKAQSAIADLKCRTRYLSRGH